MDVGPVDPGDGVGGQECAAGYTLAGAGGEEREVYAGGGGEACGVEVGDVDVDEEGAAGGVGEVGEEGSVGA